MASIAIVGTGISGMGAAALLHPANDITVYEQAAVIGGHARTLTVRHGDKDIAVDTGFIVYNYLNYPHLCGMFKHLNVPTQKSDMTFGVTINDGEFEWGARNLNAVFGQRRNLVRPEFLRLIRDVLRFNRLAVKTAERNPNFTLGRLLRHLGMSEGFSRYYILPIGGAIWSCPLDAMLEFPALSFVRFFEEHRLLSIVGQPQWHTVTGGSREYIKRLTAPFASRIRTSCAVTGIERINGKVHIADVTGATTSYDHVVLACHGDQALAMLKDPSPEEKSLLGSFRYQKNRAFLHKDASIMPKEKRCWASWIYHSNDNAPKDRIAVTYWMNLLQSIDVNYPLFVTLNPLQPIAPEHIFDEHMFEHPIYTPESIAAQQRLPSIQGRRNSWFCGAHWRNGFHEDGLSTAVDVARALGASVPWD